MIDFIIQKAGGGTINLYNKNASTLSTVTSAEQSQGLNSDDIVRIAVDSAVKIAFDIGDKMNILGRWYKINRLPTVKKTGNRLFTYNIELEGVQYDLARVVYDLTIDTTSNALQDVQADMLTGNLQRFATVLIANANRVFPGKWVLGDFPAGTEDKTLVFGETDNCLLVLQRLCSEYNTEFEIIQAGDVNTLHFRKAGQIYPYTFEYGKGKGLYSLERLNVSTANIVTRLKVYGGSRNITTKYRSARLCLPGKTKGQSFIEKADPVNKYGVWEATKYFDHIYPKRAGKVTAIVAGDVLKLIDNTMNFDLNEKEADGITTKYLIEGVTAKIHFNTGNLSGYEFEIQEYDHVTKTFTLKPFEDERGERFPSSKSTAFQFGVNDEYVILDIALPKEYEDSSEAELQAEGDTFYDQNSQPKVQYSLEVSEDFLKELSGEGSITNIFSVGDYIPVKDTDIDVDKSVRIQSFTRDLLNPFSYKLNISDTVTTSITNRVISELIDIDNVTKINDIKNQIKARRDWRAAQELLGMVFDTEGDYYSEKIKPNSIETQMLSVGAKSTQFGLVGTVIQANYNGNKNSVNVKGGVLSHYTIAENGRDWNLANNTTTLTGDATPYYIYAKCQKVGTAGSIIFSTEKITVEQDPLFYHFFVGIVNSVDPELNVRSVALTYGFTTVNGKFIRTGRIQSNDGNTYFDLDTGEIGGKITFRSTAGSNEDLAEILDGTAQDIQDTQATANAAALKAQQAIDEAEANVGLINTEVGKLQEQLDGEVSNWFYAYSPTLANYPASDWTTNTLKDRHIGDTFTNTQTFVDNATTPDAGKSWRFVKNGSTYSWTAIADSDAVKALLEASKAQATADGKNTTFLITPSNYKLGDMWVLNADQTVNGVAYKQGDILTATQDSATFIQAHWLKRVRYTDDTAVNSLEIGGRNLVLNSENGRSLSSTVPSSAPIEDQTVSGENYRRFRRTYPEGITSTAIATVTGEYFTPEKSGYYTYSTYFRPNEFDIELRMRLTGVTYGNFTLCKANEWTQVSVTAYIEAGVSTRLYGVHGAMPPELVQWIDYNRVSVTSGNKATDWSEAPEDAQARINSAKQEALNAANNVQTNVNSLSSYVDGAFKDGLIDEAEAKAIEKYKNSINESMSKAEASFAKVFANTYLEGTAKTALENAKINLWGQRDTLLATINSAIADGKTTVAEKNAVDSAFNTFNNLMSAFQSALEEANKAIQAKLDAISKGYVDALEIGGRNLIIISELTPDAWINAITGIRAGAVGHTSSDYIPVDEGQNYILSAPDDLYYVRIAYYNDSKVFISGVEHLTYVNNIVNKTPVNAKFVRFSSVNETSPITPRVPPTTTWKFEKGNKPTDWTEAPEDTDAKIADAKLTAEQAQLQAEGYMRARYVRDWLNGSSINTANTWNEIKIVNKSGTNLALGKTATSNDAFRLPVERITDNDTTTYSGTTYTSGVVTNTYIQIDLEQIYYDIDYIQIWHYYDDGRTYYGTKTEISEDGVNWTTIFDSATEGTYKETEEGKIHSQRWAKVMANLNRSKAVTDKFGTLVNGGLISPVTVELREADTMEVTAGHTGIQGSLKNLPAYWAGGTYAEALAGLAGIILRHNGTGKIGVFEVDEAGSVNIYDPVITDLLRLEFIKSKVPSVASLMSQTQAGDSVTNVARMFYSSSGSATLPNSVTVTEEGAELSFQGMMELDVSFTELNGAEFGSAAVGVYLYKDGSNYATLGGISAGRIDRDNPYFSSFVQLSKKLTVPKGVYTIVVSGSFSNALGSAGINNTSTLSWILRRDIRRFIFGSDGFASWYTENSFHFSELTGMFARGKVDIPAGLGGGRVAAGGGVNYAWGLVAGGARASNVVTINHNIGDTRYTVNVALNGSSSSWYFQNRTNTSVQVVCSGAFDFTLVRTPF